MDNPLPDSHLWDWILGGYVTLLTWLGNRHVQRVDEHDARLRALETDRVTRADIDELRQSLTASIVNAYDRTDTKLTGLHAENRETIMHINSLVGQLWERRKNPRDS